MSVPIPAISTTVAPTLHATLTPVPDVSFTEDEIEALAQKYYHYTKVAMAHHTTISAEDRSTIITRHEHVTNKILQGSAEQKPLAAHTPDEIEVLLENLAEKCKEEPTTLDKHIEVWYYAVNYNLILLQWVIGAPGRSFDDNLKVQKRTAELLQNDQKIHNSDEPPPLAAGSEDSPTDMPIVVGESKCAVVDSDLLRWRDDPESIVGEHFETMNEPSYTLRIMDYVVRTRGGASYDVRLDDDEDDSTYDVEEVLDIVQDCWKITYNSIPSLAMCKIH